MQEKCKMKILPNVHINYMSCIKRKLLCPFKGDVLVDCVKFRSLLRTIRNRNNSDSISESQNLQSLNKTYKI